MIKRLIILLIITVAGQHGYGQSNNATLRGTVVDLEGQPLDMVNIGLKDYPLGTSSNREGKFLLRVPAGRRLLVVYSLLGYSSVTDTIFLQPEEPVDLTITMLATD